MQQRCENLGPELAAYISGNLEPRRREELETHLASCQQCASSERSLRQMWQLMGTLPDEEVPSVVVRGVLATLADEQASAGPWQVVLETLFAVSLMVLLGVACPIPVVCAFFRELVVPLLGERVAFIAHTLAAAMMGLMPILFAEVLVALSAQRSSTRRRQIVGLLYVLVVGLGVPMAKVIPADPISIASWGVGLALAAAGGMWAARRLETLARI